MESIWMRMGRIQSGEGLWQVTWMDVRVGDILPTPRHGKPVEINAYWYNALCIMDELAETADKKAVYTQLKEKVKKFLWISSGWMTKNV